MSLRLPASFILTPQAQFNYTQGQFVSARVALEKRMFKNGYLNVSFERNFANNITNLELGLRYDFSFAQIGFTARRSNDTYSFVETAGGSLIVDPRSRYIGVNNRSSVGKGGMILYPFLDMNWNGIKDEGEPKAFGMEVQVSGGRVEYKERDTITRIFDLQPYAEYLVTLDGSKFDNITWRMRNRTLSVVVDPNQFKRIEIPIVIVGEASGQVYLRDGNTLRGQGRITVQFYNKDNVLIHSTLSESDGYFTYMGLAPGEYVAVIDPEQMRKLDMTASPAQIPFTIEPSIDGDYIYDLEFTIRSNAPVEKAEAKPETPSGEKTAEKPTTPPAEATRDSVPIPVTKPKPVVKDTATVQDTKPVTPDRIPDADTSTSGGYRLQFLVLSSPLEADSRYFERLTRKLPNLNISVRKEEDGLYHYVSRVFRTRSEARHWMRMINGMGWQDCVLRAETEKPLKN